MAAKGGSLSQPQDHGNLVPTLINENRYQPSDSDATGATRDSVLPRLGPSQVPIVS